MQQSIIFVLTISRADFGWVDASDMGDLPLLDGHAGIADNIPGRRNSDREAKCLLDTELFAGGSIVAGADVSGFGDALVEYLRLDVFGGDDGWHEQL